MQHKPSSFQQFRKRLAKAIIGKQFIPAFDPMGDGVSFGGTGRLNDYATKLDQMTANIGWCFVANTAIADACAAVEIKLYRKSKDGERTELTEHQILTLLDQPNLAHTGEQLKQLHYTYMNFVGESYIQMIANGEPFIPELGKLPDALMIFPAHKVQFKLGETYSDSTVKLGSQEWPVAAFVRDLNPDPDTLYSGRSVIAASAVIIDMDNRMKEWNREVFNNGAHPSLIFSSNEPMSDEAYARWKEQFNDEHTGAQNAHKPLLIEGGDAKPYMLSQKDLDFLESRKFSRDEILAMWRVNPYIIGSVENVNLATAKAARMQHAEMNIEPRVRQFVRQLNATFVKVFDPTLELDYVNPVPEDTAEKLAEATAGVDKWWTKDEVRQKYGDAALPNNAGEQIVAGLGTASLEDVLAGIASVSRVAAPQPEPASKSHVVDQPAKTPIKPALPTRGKKKELTPEELRTARGEAKHAKYKTRALAYETAMLTTIRQQFEAQRDEALGNLDTGSISKSYTRKDWLDDIVDWSKSADAFHKALAPHIYTEIIETGKDAIVEVGQEASMFDPFTPAIKDFFESRSLKVVNDVNAETKKQLRATLSQGVQDGEGGYELRARVEAVFGNASTIRADRIARTETSRAQGFADVEAWTQSGVVSGKEWFTSEDERVCDFCNEMDGKVTDLGENFFNKGDTLTVEGKSLSLSYDDVPSAPLHVGCRCVLLPVRSD